jgi:hypothetical protein
MCDALSRNSPELPEKLEIIVGHCNAHALRRFVQVTPNFPQKCQFVLETLPRFTAMMPRLRIGVCRRRSDRAFTRSAAAQ